jgi:hypothetical protein
LDVERGAWEHDPVGMGGFSTERAGLFGCRWRAGENEVDEEDAVGIGDLVNLLEDGDDLGKD